MDPGCAGLPSSGEPYSGGKGLPQSCSTELCSGGYKDSEVDPLCRPDGGGSHQAPLGHLIKAPRLQMRPTRNGGPTQRMMPTGRNDTGKEILPMAYAGTGTSMERTGRTEDLNG